MGVYVVMDDFDEEGKIVRQGIGVVNIFLGQGRQLWVWDLKYVG